MRVIGDEYVATVPRTFGATSFFLRLGLQKPLKKDAKFSVVVLRGPLPSCDAQGRIFVTEKLAAEIGADTLNFSDNPEIITAKEDDIRSNSIGVNCLDYEIVNEADIADIKETIHVPITRPGFHIYGHWIIDILPKMLVAAKLFGHAKIRYISHIPIPKFAHELIAFFGLNTPYVIGAKVPSGEPFKLALFSPVRLNDWFCRSIMKDFVCTAFSDVTHERAGVHSYGEKIFVSRGEWSDRKKKGNKRALLNRTVIEELFSQHGYRIFEPEKHSVAEQISIMSRCQVLAGEAGSGLHNCVFMPHRPESKVINIQSGRQNHLIQAALCGMYEQDSIYVIGEPITHDWMADFVVRKDDVMDAIGAAEEGV